MIGFAPLLNTQYMLYMLPAILLMLAAQWYVNSTYKKWSRIASSSRISGIQAAQRLMRTNSLFGINLEGISGHLTDHYDPKNKVLRLSGEVARGQSIAALAITAHELGHAMQDQEGYLPLRIRGFLVPVVNIGSTLGWIFILIGLFINWTGLAWLGVLFFAGGATFALATLPVEFNASARARQMLIDSGIIYTEDERRGVNNVLNAAALTYVAALATAVLQLLYYVSLVSGMGRRRD